jgi:hypothetical protein
MNADQLLIRSGLLKAFAIVRSRRVPSIRNSAYLTALDEIETMLAAELERLHGISCEPINPEYPKVGGGCCHQVSVVCQHDWDCGGYLTSQFHLSETAPPIDQERQHVYVCKKCHQIEKVLESMHAAWSAAQFPCAGLVTTESQWEEWRNPAS